MFFSVLAAIRTEPPPAWIKNVVTSGKSQPIETANLRATLTRQDEDKGDAVGRNEKMSRSVEVARDASKEDVVGRNEGARLERTPYQTRPGYAATATSPLTDKTTKRYSTI
jgi:hypothetical protein